MPQPPTGLTVLDNTYEYIALSWQPSPDAEDAEISYELVVDDQVQCVATGTEVTWEWEVDDEVSPSEFTVVAVDADGNRSPESDSLLQERPNPDSSKGPNDSTPENDKSPTGSNTPARKDGP